MAHGGDIREPIARVRGAAADLHRPPARDHHGDESVFVGLVVADEHRQPAGEWRFFQVFEDRRALVAAIGLDFEDALPGLQAPTGLRRHGGREMSAQRAMDMRRETRRLAVVQRERCALVLEMQSVVLGREIGEIAPQPFEAVQRGKMLVQRAVGAAALEAVLARDGHGEAAEQAVGVGHRPAGDQRNGAVEAPRQRRQQSGDAGIHVDAVGCRRKLQQRAIDVEKERAAGKERRRMAEPALARKGSRDRRCARPPVRCDQP